MAKGSVWTQVGAWAFIIGLLISVLAVVFAQRTAEGVFVQPGWIILVLGILGLIVGLLNVTAREATPFLVAAIALVVSVSGFGLALDALPSDVGGAVADAVQVILDNIAVFVAPAAVVVSLRAIFALAASE